MRSPDEIERRKAFLDEATDSANDLAIKAQYSAITLALEWVLDTEEGDQLDILCTLLEEILLERKANTLRFEHKANDTLLENILFGRGASLN